MSNNPALRHTDAGGPAGAIVFVHGSLSSRRIWAPYSAALGTRETIAIDLPGYGQEAAWPEGVPYRLSTAAAISGKRSRVAASQSTSWRIRLVRRRRCAVRS